ncbi:hypothetical protein SLS62_002440 [Diatrype stigma]|uniref:Uncharacterized protein n=1 Tax=Diatrype stigma TaxID=117547 RepID=A0AAN9YQT5_9PEZI
MATCLIYFVILGLVGSAQAGDDLSDFSNNLATDLGPLLSLFGDSITVQYLSESTSFLDYFIFAMAPIGIITAIVSTIRVCGSSSLRAFIGRSQEGEASIEAALCTSTSRDVCEMFNKGGITRVLGRPTILELIHDPRSQEREGLSLFRSYLNAANSSEWRRMAPTTKQSPDSQTEILAPTPNLSLNVGIIQRKRWVFFAVAATGLLLQSFTIALAGVGVWVFNWSLTDGAGGAARDYAPTMFILGTILLSAELMWLQPGPQVIGDQSFDPFAFFERGDKNLKIWTSSTKDLSKRYEFHTWITISAVLVGYIMQFIGLRGMVAWISITQLGVTAIMSLLRGMLRAQRLNKNDNELGGMPDLVARRELDWLAFQLVKRSNDKFDPDQDPAEEYKRARIVAARTLHKPYAQPELDLWLGPDTVQLDDGIIDVSQKEEYSDLVEIRHADEGSAQGKRETVRVFGWDLVHQELVSSSRGQGNIQSATSQGGQVLYPSVSIQYVWTEQSLLELCMQELFTALITSLLKLVGVGETNIDERRGHARLANPVVTEVARAFTETGLGSNSDAFMCLLPALGEQGLPTQDRLLDGLYKEAQTYHQQSNWARTEILLQWVCERCIEARLHGRIPALMTFDDTMAMRAFRDLIELYRLSLANYFAAGQQDEKRRAFGADGISWMQERYKHVPDAGIKAIIELYIYVRDTIRTENNEDRVKREFIKAIRERRQRDALRWLCFIATNDIHTDPRLAAAFPLCVRNEWDYMAQLLLTMKADPNGQDEEGRTALSHSAELGLNRWVDRFIQLDIDLNIPDKTSWEWATKAFRNTTVSPETKYYWGSVPKVRTIRDNKEWGKTPFDWAVEGKQLKTILDLAKTNKTPPDNASLLMAVERGDESMVRFLVDNDFDSQGALHVVMTTGNESMLRLLLELKAGSEGEIEFEPPGGDCVPKVSYYYAMWEKLTALARAVSSREMDLVRRFLKADCYKDGRAILWALRNKDVAMLRLLLENGVSQKGVRLYSPNFPPITFAATTGQLEALELLIENDPAEMTNTATMSSGGWIYWGVDQGSGEKVQTQPLGFAAWFGQEAAVRLLVEKGAFIDFGYNMQPLRAAVKNRHANIALYLLEHGANIDCKGRLGRTILESAVADGLTDMVVLLLKNGGNARYRNDAGFLFKQDNILYHRTDEGDTLLWTAVWNGRQSTVKLLLNIEEYDALGELQNDNYYGTLERRRLHSHDNMRARIMSRAGSASDDEEEVQSKERTWLRMEEELEKEMVNVRECLEILHDFRTQHGLPDPPTYDDMHFFAPEYLIDGQVLQMLKTQAAKGGGQL